MLDTSHFSIMLARLCAVNSIVYVKYHRRDTLRLRVGRHQYPDMHSLADYWRRLCKMEEIPIAIDSAHLAGDIDCWDANKSDPSPNGKLILDLDTGMVFIRDTSKLEYLQRTKGGKPASSFLIDKIQKWNSAPIPIVQEPSISFDKMLQRLCYLEAMCISKGDTRTGEVFLLSFTKTQNLNIMEWHSDGYLHEGEEILLFLLTEGLRRVLLREPSLKFSSEDLRVTQKPHAPDSLEFSFLDPKEKVIRARISVYCPWEMAVFGEMTVSIQDDFTFNCIISGAEEVLSQVPELLSLVEEWNE